MPEIIDILSPKFGDCPSFVVDNTVNSVIITSVLNVRLQSAFNLSGYYFDRGDNFVILSAGYYIPENFVLADYGGAANDYSLVRMEINLENAAGTINNPILNGGGTIHIPFPNYELSLGIYVNAESIIQESFSISIDFPLNGGAPSNVSMINVPADLNGDTVRIVPWIKVLHNKNLSV